MYAVVASTAVAALSASAVAGCGRNLSEDPNVLSAATTAGHAVSAVRPIGVVAVLLGAIPRAVRPADAVGAASTALELNLLGCADLVAIEGPTTGLTVAFPADGCDFPLLGTHLRGSFTFETTATEETSTWSLVFDGFEVPGLRADGSATIEILEGRQVAWDVVDLWLEYDGVAVTLDGAGVISTNLTRTRWRIDGDGAVAYDGNSFAFAFDEVEIRPRKDCYPEGGTITATVHLEAGLDVEALIRFRDSGLDTDDTGLVRVTIDGVSEVTELPALSCEN